MNDTRCVKIAILDDNVFFAKGLKYLIDIYSRLHGVPVRVLEFSNVSDIYCEWESYDSIFISLRNFHGSKLIHRALSSPLSNIILVKNRTPRINETSLYAEFPAIYRNQPASEIYKSLRYFIFPIEYRRTSKMFYLHKETGLTRRERHTAMMLASGASHSEIAETLKISVKTVSIHKRNLMLKLRIKRKVELSRWFQTYTWL